MPRFKSMAVHMAAASLGTSCLASTQWLHTWQQHRLARHASLCISYCMQCRIAWHLMSRINSMAVHMAAASLGTLCLASYQLLHVMQHRLACHASLQINGKSMAVHMAAASLGTSCLASTQWLHTWQQHRAMLQLNGCAHGSSITWHGMPCFRINGLDYASHANSCVA